MTRPGPTLTFLGATGTVTGSRFLVEADGARVLVDCGMFQGLKALRLRNWAPFPVDPVGLDSVVVTHAHLDHSGYLPALVRHGFSGSVYATRDTVALSSIVLTDSGHLLEEEAAFANRSGYSRHKPAAPLYTEADARRACERFRPTSFGEATAIASGISVVFTPAGHILGSSSLALFVEGIDRPIVFSGDLGRPSHPLLRAPQPPPASSTLVVESTYGDRLPESSDDAIATLGRVITRTAARGGTVLIPAFAVDRTEVLLFHLTRLRREGLIPDIPIAVDSPMALAALGIYRDALARKAIDIREELADGPDPFDAGNLREVRDPEGSKELDRYRGPQVIISASGMATGGRVLHHLARFLPDPRCSVILVGFQAEGTRGRRLAEGEREIKMHGRYVPVRVDVIDLPALSVHADQAELLAWMGSGPGEPKTTFVVHGEESSAIALRDRVQSDLGWAASVPRYLDKVRLD